MQEQQKNAQSLFGELWYKGELAVLYGETNIGKTQFMIQMANAIDRETKVIFIDTEFDKKQFSYRLHQPSFLRAELNMEKGISMVDGIAALVQEYGVKTIIISDISIFAINAIECRNLMRGLRNLCTDGLSIFISYNTPKNTSKGNINIDKYCDRTLFAKKSPHNKIRIDIVKNRHGDIMVNAVYKLNFPSNKPK